jgi:hypothetical protein
VCLRSVNNFSASGSQQRRERVCVLLREESERRKSLPNYVASFLAAPQKLGPRPRRGSKFIFILCKW